MLTREDFEAVIIGGNNDPRFSDWFEERNIPPEIWFDYFKIFLVEAAKDLMNEENLKEVLRTMFGTGFMMGWELACRAGER